MVDFLKKLEETNEIVWTINSGFSVYLFSKRKGETHFDFHKIHKGKVLMYLHSFEEIMNLEEFKNHVALAIETFDFNYSEYE